MTPANEKCLIRLVDDNQDFLESMVYMLACEGYRTAAYESAEAFLENDDPEIPGCLVLDVQMPELSGLELQQRLRAAQNRLPIIFLTAHANVDMAVSALTDGAFDFQQKPVNPARLLASIAKAFQSVSLWHQPASGIQEELDRAQRLSEREERILRCVARGMTSRTIAESLGISRHTVNHYRQTGADKIGVREPADLAAFFARTDEWNRVHAEPDARARFRDAAAEETES